MSIKTSTQLLREIKLTAALTTNQVINDLELPAGETFTFDSEKIILGDGDSIVVVGDSPNTLSATVSYLEV